MKWTRILLTLSLITVSSSLYAQQKGVTDEQWRLINKALIDGELAAERVDALMEQLNLSEQEIKAHLEIRRLEREAHLATKQAYLSALKTLAEHRTKRRSLFSKIITLGIRGDKRDRLLEAQIVNLEVEIMEFKP